MAIPAIQSGGFGTSLFQRANREAQRLGGQATHAKMQEVASVIGGSNFGSGTKLGKGQFHQTQDHVIQNGTQSASRAAQQSAAYMDPRRLGTSKFQKSNREAYQIGGQVTHEIMQQVKQAYATSHPVQNIGKNLDISA
jgi:hypothetical protein